MNKIVIAIVVIAVFVGGYFFLGNKNVTEETPVVETPETTDVINEEVPVEETVEEDVPEVATEEDAVVEETPSTEEDAAAVNETEEAPAEEDDLLVQ